MRRGDRVGIRIPSGSRELYLSILGVIAAGAAYVPVDVDDPEERAALVFSEALVRGVLTAAARRMTDARSAWMPRLVARSSMAPHCTRARRQFPAVTPPGLADDAWTIFTSGSTGTTEGRGRHASVGGRIRRRRGRSLRPGRSDQDLGSSARGTLGRLRCVLRGNVAGVASRCMPRAGTENAGPERNGSRSVARSRRITVVSTVPTLASLWPAEMLENVRLLIFGGEAVPA